MPLKKYHQLSIDELIEDSEFRDWVQQTTKEKDQLWKAYIKANPTAGAKLESAKKIILGIEWHYEEGLPDDAIPDPNFAKLLTNIVRLDQAEQKRTLTKPKVQRRWAIAATIALFLSVGLWFLVGENTNTSEEWVVHTTAYGEWKNLTLPDGSKVSLNANSTLKLKKDWDSQANHKVWLTGEAIFEVEKRKLSQPKFAVLTDGLTIAVMGTIFHVRNKGENTKVFLEEGHIQLATAHQAIDLRPKEFVDFTKGTRQLTIQKEAKRPNSSWKDGTLVMTQKTVKEILNRLTEIYGIPFVLTDESLATSIKTIAVPMDKLTVVLPILARTLEVEVTQNDKQIILAK